MRPNPKAHSALAASPFAFAPGDATTISGNFEALFGFLAVNFINRPGPPGAVKRP